MENNLNQKHIRRYSRDFAELVCDQFFSRHSVVSNEDIMEVQAIRQVNLFVVKNLFDQWQHEIRRLKSPYFDYEAPKVTEAMEALKNALSRNIRMDRKTYQPLLEKSVEETLRIILSPYDYYKDLISVDEELLSSTYLKATARYIKINPFIIEALISKLEEDKIGDLNHARAEQMLDAVVEQLDGEPDDVEPHIESFNKIHPLTSDELFGVVKENKPKEEIEPDSTFRTLNDNLINEERKTLADIHQHQKIEDIRSYLSINQRFMFVNSLFEGNTERFNEVIDHIERQENPDDAIHYLHAAFGEWDRQSEEVEEFFMIVRRRLS